MQRKALVDGTTPPGRSRRALADQSGRRHLPAGHSVNRVVDEEDCNFLATIGGVNDLGCSDGGQIAVSLVGDDNLVGASALQACGSSRRASVRNLHVAHIEIVISEDGAAYGTHQNRLILKLEIFQCLGDQLMSYAVPAAGTIVRLILQIRLAFVFMIERLGLPMDDVVLLDLRLC